MIAANRPTAMNPPVSAAKVTALDPSNYSELLAAALATCTVATLRMYANRKQWPLKNIEVDTIYHRAGEDDLPMNGPDRITRAITTNNSLTGEQLNRLGEIAQRCPVARALAGANVTIKDQPVAHLR